MMKTLSSFLNPAQNAALSISYTPEFISFLHNLTETARDQNKNYGCAAVGSYSVLRKCVLLDHFDNPDKVILVVSSNMEVRHESILSDLLVSLQLLKLSGSVCSLVIDLLRPTNFAEIYARLIELPETLSLFKREPGLVSFPMHASSEARQELTQIWIELMCNVIATSRQAAELLEWGGANDIPIGVQYREQLHYPYAYSLVEKDGIHVETVVDGRYSYNSRDLDCVSYMSNDILALEGFEQENLRTVYASEDSRSILKYMLSDDCMAQAMKWLNIRIDGVSCEEPKWHF